MSRDTPLPGCRERVAGSDVPGERQRRRQKETSPMKYVILIHSNPQPWGHPTSDYTARAGPCPRRARLRRTSSRGPHREARLRRAGRRRGAWRPHIRKPLPLAPGRQPARRRALLRGEGAPGRVLPDRLREPGTGRGDRREVRRARRNRRAATGDGRWRPRPVNVLAERVAPRGLAPRPRRAAAPLRRPRRLRGRGAGRRGSGGRAVAGRRGARRPARLAGPGGITAVDRPLPRRLGPHPAGGAGGRAAGRARIGRR